LDGVFGALGEIEEIKSLCGCRGFWWDRLALVLDKIVAA
jgi:hypothetical protein